MKLPAVAIAAAFPCGILLGLRQAFSLQTSHRFLIVLLSTTFVLLGSSGDWRGEILFALRPRYHWPRGSDWALSLVVWRSNRFLRITS